MVKKTFTGKQMNKQAEKELYSLDYERKLDFNSYDERVLGLTKNVSVKNKKILDSSCYDGFHCCQLSEFGAIVTASDIRPANLQMTLYRSILKGIKNMTFRCIDLEEMHLEIKKDEFDMHFFSGSFYHLKDPISVLKNIGTLFEYTLLETHIAEPDKHIPIVEKDGYNGWYYKEQGWSDNRSSKDSDNSFWLTSDSLKRLINESGLEILNVVYGNKYNPHGTRVCYLLRRK